MFTHFKQGTKGKTIIFETRKARLVDKRLFGCPSTNF